MPVYTISTALWIQRLHFIYLGPPEPSMMTSKAD